jgi:hypothetical protein
MLFATLNLGVDFSIVSACSVTSYHATSLVCIVDDKVTVCLELYYNATPFAGMNN